MQQILAAIPQQFSQQLLPTRLLVERFIGGLSTPPPPRAQLSVVNLDNATIVIDRRWRCALFIPKNRAELSLKIAAHDSGTTIELGRCEGDVAEGVTQLPAIVSSLLIIYPKHRQGTETPYVSSKGGGLHVSSPEVQAAISNILKILAPPSPAFPHP